MMRYFGMSLGAVNRMPADLVDELCVFWGEDEKARMEFQKNLMKSLFKM